METTTIKSKRGGVRPNAGAKKMPENQTREPLTLYITRSVIKRMGGKDALRKQLYAMLHAV